MRKRKHGLGLGIVAALVASLVAVIGIAVPAGGQTSGATIQSKGKNVFRVNKGASSTLRFSPGTVRVASGGTLRIVDRDRTGEPHTVTIVRRSDRPRSFDCPPCDQALKDHGGSESGPPTNILVNKGPAGFDEPGDSVFFARGRPASVTVSARAGSTLYYICAIHPWMQGRIRVR